MLVKAFTNKNFLLVQVLPTNIFLSAKVLSTEALLLLKVFINRNYLLLQLLPIDIFLWIKVLSTETYLSIKVLPINIYIFILMHLQKKTIICH